MSICVYHGATEVVDKPLVDVGRINLDFGRGFYVTDIREQAINWAEIVADRRSASPVLNVYRLDMDAIAKNYRCKKFVAYDGEWLHFIAECRRGNDPSLLYDCIEGGVANDRVVDTINLYLNGLLPEELALQRLAQHLPNNQICLLNQEIIDNHLKYERTDTL